MNRNNLNWVDNKVFSNSGGAQNPMPSMRPYTGAAPAQHQEPASGVSPAEISPAPNATGVSPETYQGMNNKAPAPSAVSPATYQDMAPKAHAPSGVSPATYQDMAPKAHAPSGVSPATFQDMAPKAPAPSAVSPATYQNMPPNDPNHMGYSPATYQNETPIYPIQTGLPGFPVGAGTPDALTRTESYAPSPFTVQGPPTVFSPGYTPAYLRSQIGKRVRAEFNIGTNFYMDRTGVLREVGVSYFVLEDNVTRVRVMCDLYSLKFLSSEA